MTAEAPPVYTGRFAPSPSGPLHFGSLVTAVASYLDARAHRGRWIVRMEDLDAQREQPGAAAHILRTLEAYGLHWDAEVLYQSSRRDAYDNTISALNESGVIYHCTCTRSKLRKHKGVYPGTCRRATVKPQGHSSLRVCCSDITVIFEDRVQGIQRFALHKLGDFVVRRRDGLHAYQLAVCADDLFQGVTHVVRGTDLLTATPWQIFLFSLISSGRPEYAHIPVITNDDGSKLSKQNRAQGVPINSPESTLLNALKALGLESDLLVGCSVSEIIQWGVDSWRMDRVCATQSISLTAILEASISQVDDYQQTMDHGPL